MKRDQDETLLSLGELDGVLIQKKSGILNLRMCDQILMKFEI